MLICKQIVISNKANIYIYMCLCIETLSELKQISLVALFYLLSVSYVSYTVTHTVIRMKTLNDEKLDYIQQCNKYNQNENIK